MHTTFAKVALLCTTLIGVTSSTVLAHHSYAMFDRDTVSTVQGTIAKVEWVNPHVLFWAYVSNGKGGHDLYGFESASVSGLARQGWTMSTLKAGDKVTIDYNPLRDGRTGGFFVSATFADGSKTPGGG